MFLQEIQGGSNMTGTNCDLFTNNQSRSYLNHLVHILYPTFDVLKYGTFSISYFLVFSVYAL